MQNKSQTLHIFLCLQSFSDFKNITLLRHVLHIVEFTHFKCTMELFFCKFMKLCKRHYKSVL